MYVYYIYLTLRMQLSYFCIVCLLLLFLLIWLAVIFACCIIVLAAYIRVICNFIDRL